MPLESGNLLNGRYRITEVLGHGGMGAVYSAIDESLGVEVAVKENLFVTEDYARQFRLEAVILASLRHPNLPRVTDHFVVGTQGQYLVMDFIAGDDLRQILEQESLIKEDEVVRIGAAICDALSYLHTRKPPVLHRDIKLGNVKVTPEGQVYLVDFGLAKMADVAEMTMTGARAMTPGYSPPEQYGAARTDARSDIYALGATLYAALTGFIPEDSLARVMDGIELTPIRKRNDKVSERLAAVIQRAMEPQPANRYQSADAFKRALLGEAEESSSQPSLAAKEPASAKLQVATEPDASVQKEIPAPDKKASKKKKGGGCLLWLVLLLAILGGGGYFLYLNPAYIPPQADAFLLTNVYTPLPPTATATFVPTDLPTATQVPTLEPSPTPTQQPSATPTTKVILPEPTVEITPEVELFPDGNGFPQLVYAAVIDNVAQLFLADVSGSPHLQLTFEPDGACQPDWSPEGDQIVFVSPCFGKELTYPNGSLFILDLNTRKSSLLVSNGYEPAWSPDGKFIVYTSRQGDISQIFRVGVSGGEPVALPVESQFLNSSQPSWSPDGQTILYRVERMGMQQIWSMTADGQNPEQFVRSGAGLSDYFPTWTVDGQYLYFSQTDSSGANPLYLMRLAAGSDTAERLDLKLPVVDADISSDGNWLAYETTAGEEPYTAYFNLPKPGEIRITVLGVISFDPVWRP